ncbi:MAG: helix-turn-helix transcriptional regulator [Pseudoxanthomonas sp.]
MTSMSLRIRRSRLLASLSQSELARRIGIQRSAVTQWERNDGTVPSVGHLAQIALETSVCFEWLATGRGPTLPDAGLFDAAVLPQDFAQDELESRMLVALRRVAPRKRETVVQLVELLSN